MLILKEVCSRLTHKNSHRAHRGHRELIYCVELCELCVLENVFQTFSTSSFHGVVCGKLIIFFITIIITYNPT